MSAEQVNDTFVDFQCPYCGSSLSFPEARLGTAQECPHCSETVVVLPTLSGNDGKLPVPIKTPRLNLRPMRPEDLADWLQFIRDEDSYKYLGYYAPNDEDAVSWLEKSRVIRLTQPNGRLDLGIELQSSAKIIGYLSFYFRDPEEHRQGIFSILIHPAYRRQGYGTETLVSLLDFGFKGLALHDMRVAIDCRNLPGRCMLEKAGMKLEGEIAEERRVKGEWISITCYGTLSKWWQRAKTS